MSKWHGVGLCKAVSAITALALDGVARSAVHRKSAVHISCTEVTMHQEVINMHTGC